MCYHCATNPSIHHHCRRVAALTSWCHLRHRIVVVLSSPSWCRLRICHGFVIAVVVLPSCRSQFRCRRRGVAFVIALSWFRCCCGVAFIITLSRCCHHGFVVAVPLLLHCCGFIVAIAMSPLSSHCRSVRCHFIIAIVVSPSSLHRHGVVVAVLLSLLRCRFCFCCCIVVTLRC